MRPAALPQAGRSRHGASWRRSQTALWFFALALVGALSGAQLFSFARSGPLAGWSGTEIMGAVRLLSRRRGSFPKPWESIALLALPALGVLPLTVAGIVRGRLAIVSAAISGVPVAFVWAVLIKHGVGAGGAAGAIVAICASLASWTTAMVVAVRRRSSAVRFVRGRRETATWLAVTGLGLVFALMSPGDAGADHPDSATRSVVEAAVDGSRYEALRVLDPQAIETAGSIDGLQRQGSSTLKLLGRVLQLTGVQRIDDLEIGRVVMLSPDRAKVSFAGRPGSLLGSLGSGRGLAGRILKEAEKATAVRLNPAVVVVRVEGRWYVDSAGTKALLLQAVGFP